ncbi:hypothetical protein [Paraburkholderia phenoliruptrix]|nr:hypothetical protein [Paraburkholderia phenoliruptrix]
MEFQPRVQDPPPAAAMPSEKRTMDSIVKNAPPRIYLNLGNLPPGEFKFANLHEVSWCADKQDDHDVEYVLVARVSPDERAAFERAVDAGGKVIPAYGGRGDMVALYADQLDAILADAACASASQKGVRMPDNSGPEAGNAPSPEAPLERPFNDVMAEISAVRPLLDQFIQAHGGDISGVGYADLLAFASTVRRETLSGACAAVAAHGAGTESPAGDEDL